MGEIINLRQVKKQRERDRKAAEAAAKRAEHGRTAAEKAGEAKTQSKLRLILDQARLDPPPRN